MARAPSLLLEDVLADLVAASSTLFGGSDNSNDSGPWQLQGLSGPDSLGSAMAAAGHPSLRHLLLLFPLLIFPFSLFWPFQHFYNWPPAFNALFAIPNEVSVFSKQALNDTAFGIRNPAPLMGVKAGLADLMRLESSEGGPHPQGTVGSAFGP